MINSSLDKYLSMDFDILFSKNSSFFEDRLLFIRSGQVEKLKEFLEELLQRKSNNLHLDLIETLLLNAYWHLGEEDKINFILDKKINFTNSTIKHIFLLYKAYINNTTAQYHKSLDLLNSIILDQEFNSKLMYSVLGVDFSLAVLTWRFWNRIELMIPDKNLMNDLKFVNTIKQSYDKFDQKSLALLFHTLGVYYLENENYNQALVFFETAKKSSINNDTVWLPRINSGLGLVDYHLGNQESSVEIDNLVNEVKNSFGPSGWQIRIAKLLILNNRKKEGISLLHSIYKNSKLKKEKSYQIWSEIHLIENNVSIRKRKIQQIYQDAFTLNMNRACNYIIKSFTLNKLLHD